MHEILYPTPREKVILAGLKTDSDDAALFDEDIAEMVQLCRTAGADVAHTLIQKKPRPEASTFIGRGKLGEARDIMKQEGIKTLVIDAALSPGQVRNIEKEIGGKVIDRSQLILDIFAQHARTNESRIQVELAQLRALYPRLTHAYTHFSQQVGGIGTRGPGEKQLEVDRRTVQRKIADLRDKLKKVEKSRDSQRKSRRDAFGVSLIGYTNVGKSSLLNALAGADVLVENKLFATLDTATRRLFLPEAGNVVLSDTVGFIRKLPHQLVASFLSTLTVAGEADLLLIVLDGSSPFTAVQLATTREVLTELGAAETPSLIVINKCDLIPDVFARKQLSIAFPDAQMVSAHNQADMDTLKQRIADIITGIRTQRAKDLIAAQQTQAMYAARLTDSPDDHAE